MDVFDRALAHVESLASGPALDPALRVTLNFHPDRVSASGVPILAALARERAYRSKFATGTSNGGLTAHPGGDRWNWESRIFGGAYDEAEPSLRPVYGGLNFRLRPDGAAPRFGSAHLRLRAEAAARATYCYPDSAAEPSDFGTARRMGLIAIAMAEHPDFRGPEFVELGKRIAVDGLLDPRIIGAAVATAEHDPQSLKYIWHYLARFGAPAPTSTSAF